MKYSFRIVIFSALLALHAINHTNIIEQNVATNMLINLQKWNERFSKLLHGKLIRQKWRGFERKCYSLRNFLCSFSVYYRRKLNSPVKLHQPENSILPWRSINAPRETRLWVNKSRNWNRDEFAIWILCLHRRMLFR